MSRGTVDLLRVGGRPSAALGRLLNNRELTRSRESAQSGLGRRFCQRASGTDGYAVAVIEPLLPTDVRGMPRADDRQVLSGMF